MFLETALATQRLRLHLPVQGIWVQSLMGDLGILGASQSKKKKKGMEQRRHCGSSIKTLKGWSTSENKYFKKRKGFIIPTLAHLANTQVGLLQRCLNYLGASVILAMHFTGFLSD